MLFDVLFVIFFYFTHKQIYAGTHFTGASKGAAMIVLIFGGVNTLLQYAYLIFFAIKDSFLHALILVIIAIVFTTIFCRIADKITLKKLIRQSFNIYDQYFEATYNRKCDIVTTVTAEIGIIINTIIIILFFVW